MITNLTANTKYNVLGSQKDRLEASGVRYHNSAEEYFKSHEPRLFFYDEGQQPQINSDMLNNVILTKLV